MIVTGFDYPRRRILVIVRGKVPRQEVFELFEMFFANPEFLSGFDVVWDPTLADPHPEWTADEVRRLVEHYARLQSQTARAPAREAVVVPRSNALSYGLARMFQMQIETVRGDVQLQIFERREEAEAWLDQPLTAARPSGTVR